MTTEKDIIKKQAEIVGQLQQFPIGRTNSGGRAGGMVEVVVTNPLPGQPSVVQANCANDCPPGDIQLIKIDNGSYDALSPNAAQSTGETRTRQVSKKNPIKPKKMKKTENIKILFYVNCELSPFVGYDELTTEKLWKELWISGTWPAKKVYTVPEGYRLADAFIINTGEKENDYVIVGRLFPVKKIHTWFVVDNISSSALPLGTPAAILFTITGGILEQTEFFQNYCPPYFWRYCGGGFFYSAGSGIGVNTLDTFQGGTRIYWPTQNYHWYNSWSSFGQFSNGHPYLLQGNLSSFLNIALKQVGLTEGNSYYGIPSKNHLIKPNTNYASLIKNPQDYTALVDNKQLLSGIDISSKWYFKTKTIESENINTFYTLLPNSYNGFAGQLGFTGKLCVTPTKNFDINYKTVTRDGANQYATQYSSGFLYEPLVVNNNGQKTLTIKQISTKTYEDIQKNFLLCLSDSGESAIFTQISGIPELNNFNLLGSELIMNQTAVSHPEKVLYDSYFNDFSYMNPLWQNQLEYILKIYYYNNSIPFSLPWFVSSNQSETNKEVLYLKDFLMSFAKFTGLSTVPLDSSNSQEINFSDLDLTHLKPLASYIENSIYIHYGFVDSNNKFFGSQGLVYSEPEKTRILPKTNKSIAKIVELILDEINNKINVAPNVKELPIYTVTPENTSSNTIALASSHYWFKTKSKGKPMPTFTPTPSEISTPIP